MESTSYEDGDTQQPLEQPLEQPQEQESEQQETTPKQEFFKIIREFIPDLLNTFPELKENLHDGFIHILEENYETPETDEVYNHSKAVIPEQFFSILYESADIFAKDSSVRTDFLIGIDFKTLWNDNISENTQKVIWKYLQLTMFSIIGDVDNKSMFGENARLFEAIDEESLKSKLEETMKEMQNVFDFNGEGMGDNVVDGSNINLENLPNPQEINDHINTMLGGKLGTLAREIAEETASEMDLNIDEDTSNVGDVFKKLFSNPGKLLSMVKNIGSKIEDKIKSGEIKESELMEEASEMLKQMKSMPGMNGLKSMMSQFGMPMGGKNSKINLGAMQAQLNQNMRSSKLRERLQKKLAARQSAQQAQEQQAQPENTVIENHTPQHGVLTSSEDGSNQVYQGFEIAERTPRVKPDKKKRKKRKKKKKN